MSDITDIEQDHDFENTSLSALDANIKQKGSNAYYYAHSQKLDGPKWDGREEPRLLRVDASPKVSTKQTVIQFDSYSWVDYDEKKLKIYIDYDNANDVDPAKINLETKDTKFKFEINGENNKVTQLFIDDLNEEISSATYKTKPTQFIITLAKQTQKSWYKLKKSNT